MPNQTNNGENTDHDNKTSSQEVTVSPKQKKSNGCLYGVIILMIFLLMVCFCSVASVVLVAFDTSVNDEIVKDGSEDQIALIRVEGVISSSDQQSLFGGGNAFDQDLVLQLERAANDPMVKAILIGIESPGGEAVASDIVAQKVLEVREFKPVVAYSSTMAASGGYMIASAADRFIVHPGDLTGSIGVIMQTSSLEGLYEKLGIDNVTIKSDRFKDNQDLFDNPNGELYEVYQGLIDESYDQFVDIIVEGRGMDEELVRELGDGRLYSGKQAVANGLADGEGYFEDAVIATESLANLSNATIVDYSTDYGWFEIFTTTQFTQLLSPDFANKAYIGVYYLPDLAR